MANVFVKNLQRYCVRSRLIILERPFTRHASLSTNRSNSPNQTDTIKTGPIRFSPSVKRLVDRHRQARNDDNGTWSVIAYNLSEELKIEKAQKLLENFSEYRIADCLPSDVQDKAVMLTSKQQQSSENYPHPPLNDIFLFREGSVVFWGVPYDQQRRLLYGLASLKVNPNASELIQEEKEHIVYILTSHGDKSRLKGDVIQINANQDEQDKLLDQFAFSHAVALSVKLGIWEMMLEEYIQSTEWITENMKLGKNIKLTKDQVFRKTGELLCLKHSINLSSDLLDLPDIFWDRNDQEAMFSSAFSYLNIRRRTNVINEKLNNCCELMSLLASSMNDRHHIRLEWMIITLITVEVAFEFVRFYGGFKE